MKRGKFWNERNIVSLITGIIMIFFIIYIGPYDGLSRDYKCEQPDIPQLVEVRDDVSYQKGIVFEKSHLSAVEIYVEESQLTKEDEIEIIIERAANQKRLTSIAIKGDDLLNGKWTKAELGKKVPTDEEYQVIVQLNTKTENLKVNLDIAFGYRDSFSLKMKVLLIAAVLVLGGFMGIVSKFFFYDSFIVEWKKEKAEDVTNEKAGEGQKKLNKKVKYVSYILILVLFTIVSCYVQYDKEGYHVDEVLTYMLANHTANSELPRNQKLTNGKEAMDTYLSVNDLNKAFNYRNVWENQHNDTHPPFYYVLVHTISSFFQNRFSKWIAFSVNLFFGLLSIVIIKKIYQILLKDERIALILTLLFAMNPAIIEMTSFLRMYVMAMFFCLLSAYWAVKHWGRFGVRFLVGNFAILVAGTLTHYYFLVYAFFVSCVIVVYLLIQKEIKTIFRFAYSVILSAGAVLIIFPGIQYHLLRGGRGTENISNFFQISDYAERIGSFVKIVSTDMAKGLLPVLIILALAGYVISRKENDQLFYWRICSITIPVFGYFFIVSKVASYITDRYMTPIYPLILIMTQIGIWLLLNYFLKSKKQVAPYAFSILFLALEVWGYKDYTWDYSGTYYRTEIKPVVEQISSYDCICMSTNKWRIWPSYPELIQYKTMTFTDFDHEFEVDTTQYTGEKLVIYVTGDDEEEEIQEIFKKFEQYKNYDVVHEDYSYCNAYILY